MPRFAPTRLAVLPVAAALVLTLAGCFEHTLTVGRGAPAGPVVYDGWEHYWLGGLVGHTRKDVSELCPGGNATIEAKQTFLNGLVAALTSGIYTPTTLRIRCGSGRRADVVLTPAEVQDIVHDERFVEWVGMDLPGRVEEVRRALADG